MEYSAPYGLSFFGNRAVFKIFSSKGLPIFLQLYHSGSDTPYTEIEMVRTDSDYQLSIDVPDRSTEYTYRVGEKGGLIDPYAKILSSSNIWGEGLSKPQMRHGVIAQTPPFNWDGTVPPQIPLKDLIIYELHVRGMTIDPSSNVANPGTFLGLIEKIPYLKDLGINAVELMPIHEFDERHPNTSDLCNFWGYSTYNFFCPMKRYCVNDPIIEFKSLVKACHEAGIEVILDVVYNHTCEGTSECLCFGGIDPNTYYIRDCEGSYGNYTGCGNTLNCNHPKVTNLILDSLRYWVEEMRVDGFRFDLATIFCRSPNGELIENSPILRAIEKDPILSQVKLIAEPWDATGGYQVGSFPSHLWAEWNGIFRDSVRKFIKGSKHTRHAFEEAVKGSPALYAHNRTPSHSINFVTAHDGFTLRDLVSYNHKHNEANSEKNRDGTNHNLSWNCGVEGETKDRDVIALRQQQMKNFAQVLLTSLGTPMLLMGDEVGLTRFGNNNPWCQDNGLNAFDWNRLDEEHALRAFVKQLIRLRTSHDCFRQDRYTDAIEILPSPQEKFFAYTLGPFYLAYNASHLQETCQLPDGHRWMLISATHPHKHDPSTPLTSWDLPAYSALICKHSD